MGKTTNKKKYDVPMYVTLTDLHQYHKILMREYPSKEMIIKDIYHDYLNEMENGLHPDDMILDCASDLHHVLGIRKKR